MYGRYLGIREQRAQLLAAASKGDVDEVRRLWEEGNTFLRSSAQYTLGVSPLIAAIRHGQHAVARFFIENKVYIHQKGGKGRTPLFYACERRDEELVDLLLATTAEVKVRDGVGQTALIVAAQQGSVPIVRRLIEKCKEMVNFKDYLGQTALLVAAAGGYLEVVKELVLRGNADVSLADHDGVKPVSMAKMKGHQDCVDFLMEVVRSARENVVAAVRGGQTDEVTRLLTLGGAKLLKFRYGDDEKTLLMIAAEAGKADMVRMLANKIMFDVNAKSSGNKTALHLAVEREGGPALDVMKVLMEKHATLMYDDQGMTPLMHAAEKGLDGAVRVLVRSLKHTWGLNATNHQDRSALFLAACAGREGVVRILLSHAGVDKMRVDEDGETPLMAASRNGHTDVVRLMLRYRRDADFVDARDYMGRTATFKACAHGHTEVLRLLLMVGGAAYELPEFDTGRMPRAVAQQNGHMDCSNLIRGVMFADAACLQALADNDVEEVGRQLELGGPGLLRAQYGEELNTLLMLAINNDSRAMVSLLLERGAKPNHRVESGRVALMMAAEQGRDEIVSLLLERGALLTAKRSDSGWNSLHFASMKNNLGVVKLLLGRMTGSTLVDQRDKRGRTALHVACEFGCDDVVMELILTGKADVRLRDEKDRMPANVAQEKGHFSCVYLVRSAMFEELYMVHKARVLHEAERTHKPPSCLMARLEKGDMPMPTLVLEPAAEEAEAGEGGGKRKRDEEALEGQRRADMVRHLVEELGQDLYVELRELILGDPRAKAAPVSEEQRQQQEEDVWNMDDDDDDEELVLDEDGVPVGHADVLSLDNDGEDLDNDEAQIDPYFAGLSDEEEEEGEGMGGGFGQDEEKDAEEEGNDVHNRIGHLSAAADAIAAALENAAATVGIALSDDDDDGEFGGAEALTSEDEGKSVGGVDMTAVALGSRESNDGSKDAMDAMAFDYDHYSDEFAYV